MPPLRLTRLPLGPRPLQFCDLGASVASFQSRPRCQAFLLVLQPGLTLAPSSPPALTLVQASLGLWTG